MSVLNGLEARIATIVGPVMVNGHMIPQTFTSAAEVRLYVAEITRIQKSLRLLKSEINNESKQVGMGYSDKITNASSHPILGAFAGKKTAAHATARDRQRMRHNKQVALAPYHNATAHIDRYIGILDGVKINVQQQALHPTTMLYRCNHCGYQIEGPVGGPPIIICPRCGR